MNQSMEPWTTGTGQRILVHNRVLCSGRCPIHAPTDHHMLYWPTHWSVGAWERGMERVCEHGMNHPDPDCLFQRIRSGDHEPCDGCCIEEETRDLPMAA